MDGSFVRNTYLFRRFFSELDLGNQEELMDRIKHGVFTLRDMMEQFENLQKLGSLGQIMVSLGVIEVDLGRSSKICY